MEPEERVIRVTSDEALADEWQLALLAEEIPHRVELVDDQWAVIVHERDASWAMEELDELSDERRTRAAERAAPPPPEPPSLLGALAAGLLVVFHAWAAVHPGRLLDAGASDAARVLHGEPWRAVTALTLHADWVHVGGNAVAVLILFTALGRLVGSGVGAWLVLLGGALGNLANAALHAGAGHSSIGASTATFAAIGTLAALQLRRRRAGGARRMRALLPVAAALGLFAMLGTGGRETDVLAHLFGLGAGLAVGLVAALALRRRVTGLAQPALALSALAAVAGCWLLALR